MRQKVSIVLYRANTPMPSFISLVLALLLLLMVYLSYCVFAGVTTNVTNACVESTRDGGNTANENASTGDTSDNTSMHFFRTKETFLSQFGWLNVLDPWTVILIASCFWSFCSGWNSLPKFCRPVCVLWIHTWLQGRECQLTINCPYPCQSFAVPGFR